MSITAQPLNQAREALIEVGRQRMTLIGEVKEQGRKITELEREVQKQANALSQARQALADAKLEIEALRSQLPDEATRNAFESLAQFLACPAEEHPELRIAA